MSSPRLLASVLASAALVTVLPLAAGPSSASSGQEKPGSWAFAVIGDVPYGAEQIAAFPGWIDRINAEPGLDLAFHDGDSHVYNVDRPVADGSRWLDVYEVDGRADNLTRVTVDGEANNTNFLKVTVTRPGADRVLTWERVRYDS